MIAVTAPPDADAASVVPELIEIIRPYDKSGAEGWGPATEIGKIGIDSFDFVEIVFKIEDKYGIDIDYNANTKFAQLTTIGDLAKEVSSLVAAKTAA